MIVRWLVNAANTRQARSEKREAIFHRKTCLARYRARDGARWRDFPNFDNLQVLSVVNKANLIVMSLFVCTDNFLASSFSLTVCLRLYRTRTRFQTDFFNVLIRLKITDMCIRLKYYRWPICYWCVFPRGYSHTGYKSLGENSYRVMVVYGKSRLW